MSITRFSHVRIYCTNLEASLDFYRDVLESRISDRKSPKGYHRAAIGCFVDGAWCLHFFQATAEQRTQFETLPIPRTGMLMHMSLRAEGYIATRARLVVTCQVTHFRDGTLKVCVLGTFWRGWNGSSPRFHGVALGPQTRHACSVRRGSCWPSYSAASSAAGRTISVDTSVQKRESIKSWPKLAVPGCVEIQREPKPVPVVIALKMTARVRLVVSNLRSPLRQAVMK